MYTCGVGQYSSTWKSKAPNSHLGQGKRGGDKAERGYDDHEGDRVCGGDGERRRSLDAAEPAEVVTKAAEVEAAMAAEAADDEAKFEQLFRELDADNSGEIDEEELADWILRVRPQSPFKSAMPFQELLD